MEYKITKKGILFYAKMFDDFSSETQDWLLNHAFCFDCNVRLQGKICGCGSLNLIIPYALKNEFQKSYRRELRKSYDRKNSAIRSGRMKEASGHYLEQDIDAIFSLQKGLCYYCKKQFMGNDGNIYFEVEHLQPISRGGSNWPSNLALACKSCNQKKGDMSEADFWGVAKKNIWRAEGKTI